MYRDNTKVIKIGDRIIGGGNPILIQSMTNTKTEDVQATVAQINELEAVGCEIIRCAVPTMEAAKALGEIKKQINIPIVADIHFDYKLAIAAIENGADKIRINPGNIGSIDRIKAVVDKAKEYNVPIRVGVNSGSLEKELVEKYNGVTAQGIVESALDKVRIIEELGYDNTDEALALQHIVLSHHGKLEYGSPVLPVILEAEVMYLIDNMDSKIVMINKALKDVEDCGYSHRVMGLEGRSFYKHSKTK